MEQRSHTSSSPSLASSDEQSNPYEANLGQQSLPTGGSLRPEGAPPLPQQIPLSDEQTPPSFGGPTPSYPSGYQQPEADYQSPAYPLAVTEQSATTNASGDLRKIKDDRSLLTLILLSIVTCGIYSYYNIYTMAQDMNTMCSDDDETTGGLGIYILLCFVTFGIYGLYWEYKLANRIKSNAPRYGVTVQEGGTDILLWRVLGLLLCFIGSFYGYYLLLQNINKLAKAYNQAYGLEY